MEDRELLREYVEFQSEKAFTELVSRHLNLVYGVARRIVGECQMAQDIAQVVFIRLAREGRFIRDGSRLSGWLYRATCNAAANSMRTEQRRREREGKAVNEANLNSGAEAAWERIAPFLEEAMGQLKQTDQDAIVLRYFEGKSLQEVSQRLAMSDDAVQKRISRALEKLRVHFAGRGLKCSSALLVTILASASAQAAPVGLATGLAASSLASAASMGGTTVATFLETIFMTKTKAAIIASVMVTTVVSPIVVQRNENSRLKKEVTALKQDIALTQSATNDALGATRPTTANVAAAAVDWRALESPDYRTYIANLRAAGCPEQTIRDIIITDVDRNYSQRIAKLSEPVGSAYWQARDPSDGLRQHLVVKQIEEEKRAAIRELLGIDPDEEFERRTGIQAGYTEGFEFLSADQRARLREIERQAQAKIDSLNLIPGGWASPDYRKQQGEAYAWKEAVIKELLGPKQFEEYELRMSNHAHRLQNELRSFNPTEQEFRTIYQLQKQFGMDNRSGEGEPSNSANGRQYHEAVKQALGEQRYGDYELTSDSTYAILYDIVRTYGVPQNSGRAVYDMHKAAELRAAVIRQNSSLTPEAREAAFQALVKQTQEEASGLLGDEAFPLYTHQFSAWFYHKLSK